MNQHDEKFDILSIRYKKEIIKVLNGLIKEEKKFSKQAPLHFKEISKNQQSLLKKYKQYIKKQIYLCDNDEYLKFKSFILSLDVIPYENN